MEDKNPTFVSLNNDLNSMISLILLARETSDLLPTKSDLYDGAEMLGIEMTPEIFKGLKETFPELDI